MTISVTCYASQYDDQIVIEQIKEISEKLDTVFVMINIDGDQDLEKRYAGKTPVLKAGPFTLVYPFSNADVEVMIRSAVQRSQAFTDNKSAGESNRGSLNQTITFGDRFGLWFTRNYVWVVLFILFVYVGLPFLAPVLEKYGNDGLARVIYTVYKPFCHQLTFRSFFLFGEQPYYPRQLANVPGVLSYEQITGSNQIDILQARDFIGNAILGFKVGMCERDIAIYLSVILFGLIFQLTGRKLKQLPWYLWIIIAVVPIGLDGFSQLPSLMVNPPAWMPIRESTPMMRVITGGLFGFFSAWFVFPLMEESISTTRVALLRKFAIVKKLEGKG